MADLEARDPGVRWCWSPMTMGVIRAARRPGLRDEVERGCSSERRRGTAEALFLHPADRLRPKPAGGDPTSRSAISWRRPTIDPVPEDMRQSSVEGHDLKVWFPVGGSLSSAAPPDPAGRRRRQLPDLRRRNPRGGGESGSGKSTLSRAALNLIGTTAGSVTVLGRDITHTDQAAMRAARRDLQIVFQDPLAKWIPSETIGDLHRRAAARLHPSAPSPHWVAEVVVRTISIWRVGPGSC